MSQTLVGIAHLDATFAQSEADRVGVDVEPLGDSGRGETCGVEAFGLVDVFFSETDPAGFDAFALEDLADCSALDAEAVSQLVDRGSCLICLDQRLDLLFFELLRCAMFWAGLLLWCWCGGVGERGDEVLEGLQPGAVVPEVSLIAHTEKGPGPEKVRGLFVGRLCGVPDVASSAFAGTLPALKSPCGCQGR